MVTGRGSAREVAPTGLVVGPVAVAACPVQPAARRARPAAAAATARRVVILSMAPPVCRYSAWTLKRRDAAGIGAAPRAGLWPARIFPAAAVPQSGHGPRGAPTGRPGTPGRPGRPRRAWSAGRFRTRRHWAGGARPRRRRDGRRGRAPAGPPPHGDRHRPRPAPRRPR